MAKLIHNKKTILSGCVYATNPFRISRGLMLTGKKGIEKGIIMKIPIVKSRLSAAVTMAFCLYSMDIIFLDENFKVVDRVILKPWKMSYIPKQPAKYVIESTPNKFKNIKIGDIIKIEL